jgi:membrane-associated PAP2 superfamily phosphatase
MQPSTLRLAWASTLALFAILLWDLSGLDLGLAQAAGGPQGFPLRDDWVLTTLLHTGGRYAAWLTVLALCLAVIWPVGPLRRLAPPRRVQLAASALLASGVITLLKNGSHTSCPWDLHAFGGVATHVSHWSGWGATDGGAGRCFPAGHAATGFAFLGGFFALRDTLPRLAKAWLAGALVAGLGLGLAQQLRGAHFMSHTLWTGWICWMTAWLCDPHFAGAGAAPVEGAAP